MTPRISVVIPTYNRAHLVGQAIDSALAQSYGNVEIVVVDDGSTDDTAARVAAYGSRVRYVRTDHGGVAHGRNVGTQAATGAYLAYLDSDDRLYPYTLELQAALLERFPQVAFVCAEMSAFDDHGFADRYHLKRYHASTYRDPSLTYDRMYAEQWRLQDLVPVPPTLTSQDPGAGQRGVYVGQIFDTYLRHTVLCQNTVLYRREAVIQAGDRNRAVRHWQELDYLLRICRHAPICFVDVPTYQLRYHDQQISQTGGPDGKAVWARKQRILLRVISRHAHADADYYARHRAALDRTIARLHRAAAVPLLLCAAPPGGRIDIGRRARAYLRRDGGGLTSLLLLLTTCLPESLRRAAVTVYLRIQPSLDRVVRRLAGPGGGWRGVLVVLLVLASVLVVEDLGADWLNRLLIWLPGVDKLLHTMQSFVIFRILYWALSGRLRDDTARVAGAILGTIALAGFDEIQQMLAPGRSVELADIAASTTGALLGASSVVVHRARALGGAMAVAAAVGAMVVLSSSYVSTRDYKDGLRLEATGRYAEAVAAFDRALAAGVENPELYNTLAWSILQTPNGDAARAVRMAARSLELRPGDAGTLDTYGWSLFRAGRPAEALDALRAAEAGDPSIYCLGYHLGATYLALDDRPTAARYLRSQIERFPAVPEAAAAAALLRQMDGR